MEWLKGRLDQCMPTRVANFRNPCVPRVFEDEGNPKYLCFGLSSGRRDLSSGCFALGYPLHPFLGHVELRLSDLVHVCPEVHPTSDAGEIISYCRGLTSEAEEGGSGEKPCLSIPISMFWNQPGLEGGEQKLTL